MPLQADMLVPGKAAVDKREKQAAQQCQQRRPRWPPLSRCAPHARFGRPFKQKTKTARPGKFLGGLFYITGSDVESEQRDVSVLHNVILALRAYQSLFSGGVI